MTEAGEVNVPHRLDYEPPRPLSRAGRAWLIVGSVIYVLFGVVVSLGALVTALRDPIGASVLFVAALLMAFCCWTCVRSLIRRPPPPPA